MKEKLEWCANELGRARCHLHSGHEGPHRATDESELGMEWETLEVSMGNTPSVAESIKALQKAVDEQLQRLQDARASAERGRCHYDLVLSQGNEWSLVATVFDPSFFGEAGAPVPERGSTGTWNGFTVLERPLYREKP